MRLVHNATDLVPLVAGSWQPWCTVGETSDLCAAVRGGQKQRSNRCANVAAV